MQKSVTTVLGNRTDEHQKAFFELLVEEAFHNSRVMLASDGIPAGEVCQLYCLIDEMEILASSVDDAIPAVVGGRRPAEGYIKRKLVEWYKLAPKSDRHDPC